jgi:mono/diheme cytochrome c family protein
MKRVLLTVVGAAFLSGAVVFAQDAKVEAGKKAYETQKCSTCHVIAGKGTKGVGSVLDGIGAKLTAPDLKKWFTETAAMEAKLAKKPVVKMSDYLKLHKLADADVEALVAYMQSLK